MTISWYSISTSLQSDGPAIFNGYFSVDDATHIINGFYETINGYTNYNNNILITNLENITNGTLTTNPSTGYDCYDIRGYTINNVTINNEFIVDNIYVSKNPNYPGFTPYGVALTSFSYYDIPNSNTVYNFAINLYPDNKYFFFFNNNNPFIYMYANISPIINPTLPTAPTNIKVKNYKKNNHITLSWSTPSSTGGSSIVNYIVNVFNKGNLVNSKTTNNLSFTFTGLKLHKYYEFTVIAVNSFGQSPPSSKSHKIKPNSIILSSYKVPTTRITHWHVLPKMNFQ